MVSWPICELTKWQYGQMDSWPNGKLTKWETVKMASWLNGELTKWRVGQMLSWPKGLEPNLLPLTFLQAETGPSTGRTPTLRSSSCCRRRCRSWWWSDEPQTSSSGSWSGCYVWTRCGRPSDNVVKLIWKWQLIWECLLFAMEQRILHISN